MKDWLRQIIIQKATSFLITGQEVEPTFFGVNAKGRLLIVPLGELFSSEAGMNRAVALCQGLVSTHRLVLTALVYEAWLSQVENLKHSMRMRPSQNPKRKEQLILMLETSTNLEGTAIPIENRKLQLRQSTALADIDTCFRFFAPCEPPPLAA